MVDSGQQQERELDEGGLRSGLLKIFKPVNEPSARKPSPKIKGMVVNKPISTGSFRTLAEQACESRKTIARTRCYDHYKASASLAKSSELPTLSSVGTIVPKPAVEKAAKHIVLERGGPIRNFDLPVRTVSLENFRAWAVLNEKEKRANFFDRITFRRTRRGIFSTLASFCMWFRIEVWQKLEDEIEHHSKLR